MSIAPRHLRFGRFVLDRQTCELRRSGNLLRLAPQPARLLTLLATRAGELVTRAEIQREIWPDTIIEFDKGLNTCMRQVREALGDSARSPTYIETVHRRGYRFIAPVDVLDPSGSTSEDAAPAPPSPPGRRRALDTRRALVAAAVLLLVVALGAIVIRGPATDPDTEGGRPARLVVLPFTSRGSGTGDGDLADALTAEIINRLASVAPDRLQVIARTSSMRYRDSKLGVAAIAAALSADYVLEGSIFGGPDGMRVAAQLIRASDEATLWTERIDAGAGDVFALQDDLGRRVARSLAVELVPATRQWDALADAAARDAYLRARQLLDARRADAFPRAAAEFEDVTRRAPAFAPAFSGLAMARLRADDPAAAETAADSALALDDGLAEAHLAKGQLLFVRHHQPAAARSHFERAARLAPGDPDTHLALAYHLLTVGERGDAFAHVEKAWELDPMSALLQGDAGIFYYWTDQLDRAAEACRQARDLDPDFPWAYLCLMRVHRAAGRNHEAALQIEPLMRLEGAAASDITAVSGRPDEDMIAAYRGWKIARLERLSPRTPDVELALATYRAEQGDAEAALGHLLAAFADPPMGIVALGINPSFACLHDDSRFIALLERIGVPLRRRPAPVD